MSSRADQAADLLAEVMTGRDRAELANVLGEALDVYELARVIAVARTHLGRVHGATARQEAIDAGYLRPTERPPADLGNRRPLEPDPST